MAIVLTRSLVIGPWIVLLALAGCGKSAESLQAGAPCLRTTECADGLACVEGVCGRDLSRIAGEGVIAPTGDDAGAGPVDGGAVMADGGRRRRDGGPVPPTDAGPPPPPVDAGPPPPTDAGPPPPMDAGPPPPMDAGPPPPVDAGAPAVDAG